MPTKPKLSQPETPDIVQERDLFYTPKYAVDLLVPFIPKEIKNIWECAAGDLHITRVLKEYGYKVLSSDIRMDVDGVVCSNFLTDPDRTDIYIPPYAIITNPPFSIKKRFYERCKEYGVAFALLLPADYCGWLVDAVWKDVCEKIIPNRRINYITPFTVKRVNELHNTEYTELNQIPHNLLVEAVNHPGSMVHSMWLTWGFNIGKSETFVELTRGMMENV
jgi:hypothetical protein